MVRFDNCPCCDSHEISSYYLNKDKKPIEHWDKFFFGSRKYIEDIHKCRKCDFHFINKIENNHSNFYQQQDPIDYLRKEPFRERYFLKVKSIVKKDLLDSSFQIKTMIDIGAGNGSWLKTWKGEGVERYASEMSPTFIENMKGQDITILDDYADDSEKVLFRSRKKFDMITMFDFLEHLEDPNLFLEKSFNTLNEKGLLVVGVPHMDKWPVKLLKTKYYLYCPMHFSYFTKKGLFQILSKYFDRSKIKIYNSPSMVADTRTIGTWLGVGKLVRKLPTVVVPIGYSSNLIAIVKK